MEDIAAEPEITIYPNPTNGMFNVDFNKATSIQVIDLLGATVYNEKLEDPYAGTKSIDLSNLSNGIYFICVYNEDRSTKRKLILNK